MNLMKLTTTGRRDSSYLEWHYKRPTDEELSDQYECFTEEEWAAHYQAAKEETSLTSRKKKNVTLMNDEAKKLACDGCELFFQLWSRNRGLCHPVAGAVTPMDRLGEENIDA
jgi:TorA maturation chaperone TorD